MTSVDERPVRSDEAELAPPPSVLRPELQQALRREIEQAIAPVLADFREQSARTARQQADEAQRTQPSEPSGSVLHTLEHLGTQWVHARIEDGRGALCSEPARARVRESIERAFHPLLEAGLELVPGEATRRALEKDSERALDELVGDALEHVCSERMLTDLQQHAEAALYAFVRLDIATMLREVWEAVYALLRAFLLAVHDEWQRLLHLVLDVLLKATQELVGTIIKDGLAALVPVPVEDIEEKAGEAKETIGDRLTDVRDRLAERIESLRDRTKEEVEKVKERVAEGLKSAVEGDTQGDKFGRPPTGRPPSLRPPSGRSPSGRPPSGRPPSGRPPSLTRRRA